MQSEKPMKKNPTKLADAKIRSDEILPQYDFRRSRPNKYAAKYSGGGTVVVIDPKLSALFPTAASVNRALQMIADTAKASVAAKKTAGRPR